MCFKRQYSHDARLSITCFFVHWWLCSVWLNTEHTLCVWVCTVNMLDVDCSKRSDDHSWCVREHCLDIRAHKFHWCCCCWPSSDYEEAHQKQSSTKKMKIYSWNEWVNILFVRACVLLDTPFTNDFCCCCCCCYYHTITMNESKLNESEYKRCASMWV